MEILLLNSTRENTYTVTYMGQRVIIKTIKEVKICGIWYCNNREIEYKLNIKDKITKMGSMIKSWRNRNLTPEGKSLIIKTFGLSQIIYGMHICEISDERKYKID